MPKPNVARRPPPRMAVPSGRCLGGRALRPDLRWRGDGLEGVLAAQRAQAGGDRGAAFDPGVKGAGVTGQVPLQGLGGAEQDQGGAGHDQDAGDLPDPGGAAAHGPRPGRRPPAQVGDQEQGYGGPGGVAQASRATASAPTRWVAPTTVMAASTGPAQGTKTSPRLAPSNRPLRAPPPCWGPGGQTAARPGSPGPAPPGWRRARRARRCPGRGGGPGAARGN